MARSAGRGVTFVASYRTIDDLDVKGKRVLVRADLNVPMKDGVVTDATRIARQAPTIRELSNRGALGERAKATDDFPAPEGWTGLAT